MDFQAFYEGRAFDAYEYFGAHPIREGGVIFRTYAPNAEKVSIFGEFSGWHEVFMGCPERYGIYEIYIPEAYAGQMYKYVIYSDGKRIEHCDPYGFGMELRPSFASIVRDLSVYTFGDWGWMQRRNRGFDRPVNIFELHLGSFRRHNGDVPGCWYRYGEIADELVEYLRKYHFTHVEFMPFAEYPYDGSWGYQQTGFFAPTARYGTAAELMELIDRLHREGFGAILDFIPSHFAADEYALRLYDGSAIYENPDENLAISEWGTRYFNFARGEAVSFIQSCAAYWLDKYHFDGLRMDAVSRMIYWKGDEKGGVNEYAVSFLKQLTKGLHDRFPTAILAAEDSSAYEGCTRPVEEGGLGFDYKWDLGWMHDTLDFFSRTPAERLKLSERLTFTIFYHYNERYLLALSHDEVVHGKKAIVDKLPGRYEEKLCQARLLYLYMLVHPGKKLNFMGNELAMFREWDVDRESDYYLLRYPMHAAFSRYFARLWEIYERFPALYVTDDDPAGFTWVAINDGERNVYAIRRSLAGTPSLVALFNFSDREEEFRYRPGCDASLHVELSSEWETFGGPKPEESYDLFADSANGVAFRLAPCSGLLFSEH